METIQPLMERALNINGWMFPPELHWLGNQARRSNIIIEVGCHHGRSTRVLADNTDGIIFAVDPWDNNYKDFYGNKINLGDDCYEVFCGNLEDHIATGRVVPVRSRFERAILPKADFIFLDGEHHYDCVIRDISHARDLLIPGSILAGHDYGYSEWPGVKEAVDHIFPNIETVNSIWITRV